MRISFFLLILCSCITREQVEADIFSNKKAPDSLCGDNSDLWNIGINRKISCKNVNDPEFCPPGTDFYLEYISYCDAEIENYGSMNKENISYYLGKLTTPKKAKK